jgi:hypothetical protein
MMHHEYRVIVPHLGSIANQSYGVRLIGSPAARLEPGGAISESVLSDSNGLRHSRVAGPRNLRRASREAAVDFAALAFWASKSGKTAKAKGFFRRAKRAVSRRWPQVLEIIGARNRGISRNCLFSMT